MRAVIIVSAILIASAIDPDFVNKTLKNIGVIMFIISMFVLDVLEPIKTSKND